MHVVLKGLIAVLVWLALSVAALADGERVALVIGNSQYEAVPSLDNPVNDATDVGASLERLGFEVTRAFDLNSRGLNIALRDFSRVADAADMAIIYFAGHGMEIENRNYLVPVDAVLERASDVTFEAVEMTKFLSAVSGAATLRLVLLDACRDNPFLVQMAGVSSRSLGRGLGSFEPQAGVLVGYSAKGGTVALDGEGRNSPYAEALLQHLETPGLEIGQLFRRVRDTVLTATEGLQEPFTYGSLPARDIFLAAAMPAGPSAGELLGEFLKADRENTVEGWQRFLGTYGEVDSEMVDRAREKLGLLLNGPGRPGANPGFEPAAPDPLARDRDSPLIRACDQLAADPDDPDRPDGVAGVVLEEIDAGAAVTACTLATSGHPENARSQYQLSRALTAAGSAPRARLALERATEMGHPRALAAFGEVFLKSPGDRATATRAIEMLDAAMAAGDVVAPRILGDFFSRPATGFVFEGRQPLEYYRIAAERGDVPAMYEAGYRLVSLSQRAPEDIEAGIAFLEGAAEAGNTDALNRLASFYLSQRTPEAYRDAALGISYLRQAAKADAPGAAQRLARRYKVGDGVRQDLAESARWIELLAVRGDSRAMVENGYNWEIGRGKAQPIPSFAAESYIHSLRAGNGLVYTRVASEWPREVALGIQRRLQQLDGARYRGPIDGVVGPQTRAAMQRLCKCREASASVSFTGMFAAPLP